MTTRSLALMFTIGSLIVGCGGSGTGADASASAASALRSGVTGVVRDASTGAAVGGVAISDGQRSTSTAADGSYRLAEAAGTYTLTATKQGYATASQQVTVPRNRLATLDWRLTASSTPATTAFKVFGNNDLGMHCVDDSFAVFSILPPYNVVDVQVVALHSSGPPTLLDATQADVRYDAVADATGSINSTSLGKSDFWTYAAGLYGVTLANGEGLEGLWMPADAPSVAGRTLGWDTALGTFRAPGIPIFPVDDAGNVNRYPLMRFSAYDKHGALLGSSDVVLPVSEETSCSNCHATGKAAAPAGTLAWSTDPDLERQARQNVLVLHDARMGTSLAATAPVLCANCHYSPVLDLAGKGPSSQQSANVTMSGAMHAFHADKMAGLVDAAVPVGGKIPSPTTQACYQCHPGASTQCLRGAMTTVLDCQNCHGNMAAVGGEYPLLAGGSIDGANDGGARRPWLDLPRCQSCHANDAVAKTTLAKPPPLAPDGLRFVDAYRTGDPSASPILATNPRFAEETGKLYRRSKGHGGLACEACHGSTHAIWSGNANDDVEARQLQGHAGLIGECSACHQAPPTNGLGGPHGMHPVGSSWVSAHPSFAQSQLASCQPCHGTDDRGTVLSRMLATRTLAGQTLSAGTVVGCYTCHNGPNPN